MNTEHSPDAGLRRSDSTRLPPDWQGPPVSRREAVRRGLLGAAGLMLADHLGPAALAAARPATAKSVIQIWMWGGPCHLDTFDPKPDAGARICFSLPR